MSDDQLPNQNSSEQAPENVIPFRPTKASQKRLEKSKQPDSDSIKLMRIADEIDALILHHVQTGNVDLRDLAGLLSHRLGTLMSHIDNKEDLMSICLKVLKRQAKVD